MGVAKKNRRSIDVDGRVFVWYIAEDVDDFPTTIAADSLHALNIVSDDKHFVVRFHLAQRDSLRRHITVLGHEFAGAKTGGCWRRFRCPDWCPAGIATPGIVRSIIEWCLDAAAPRVEVNYCGEVIGEEPNNPRPSAVEQEAAD